MKVIFLDIDGVLQPYNSLSTFENIDKKIIHEFTRKFSVDYFQYNISDISAVYYDWNEQAISRLKYALDQTNSKIIISSDWRIKEYPYKMRDLLKIVHLDNYWYSDNIIMDDIVDSAKRRSLEIKDSLERFNIENYVVLDDMKGLDKYFPFNTVKTNNYMTIDDMNKCIKILKKENKLSIR